MREYKLIGIIGLGIFGRALVKELTEYNTEVIGIDKEMHNVNAMKPNLQSALQSDTISYNFLEDVGFSDVDIAIVGSGMNLQDTVIVVEHCLELNVKQIFAVADSSLEEKILYKMGADEVIVLKVQMGKHTARKIMRPFVNDMVELKQNIFVAEFDIPKEWHGQTISSSKILEEYGIHVIGTSKNEEEYQLDIDANLELDENTHLIGIAKKEQFDRFAEETSVGYDLKMT